MWARSKPWVKGICLPLFLLGLLLIPAGSADAQQVQSIGVSSDLLREVGIDQKLGNQVPMNLDFRDEHGNPVQLGQFFDGKPMLLALVYYRCPLLCTQIMDSVLNSLKRVPLDAGKDFNVVMVSIDPTDRPIEAEAKKVMYAGLYGRPGAAAGWHFLTGEDPQIHRLAEAVGFRYAYDPDTEQYAHAAAIMILTPGGKVSRYFYGIKYQPRDLRLGLVEASSDKIGSPVDAFLLYCYHYDPRNGKYDLLISNVIRILGLATVLGIGILIFVLSRQTQALPGNQA
jgi:protein SCO1